MDVIFFRDVICHFIKPRIYQAQFTFKIGIYCLDVLKKPYNPMQGPISIRVMFPIKWGYSQHYIGSQLASIDIHVLVRSLQRGEPQLTFICLSLL